MYWQMDNEWSMHISKEHMMSSSVLGMFEEDVVEYTANSIGKCAQPMQNKVA